MNDNIARYYDPGTGRFLSEDPIGFVSQDNNFYRYVFNNPARYNDPIGKIPPLLIIGGIIIGFILPPDIVDDDKTIDWSPEQDPEHLNEANKYFQKMLEDEENNQCG